ncbi:MAG: type II and III secretion system protein family protein [Dyella sp.]
MASLGASGNSPDQSVALQVHEQRPWALPSGVERIAVADPDVADVIMLKGKNQALLAGKAPGQTTLLLWLHGQAMPQRYRVEVRNAIQTALMNRPNEQLLVQDDQALLQGTAGSTLEHEQLRGAAISALGDKGKLIDASTVAAGGVVQVEVKVVEFNKTAMRQIGLNLVKTNGGFSYGMFGPSTLNSASVGAAATDPSGGATSTVGGLNFDAKQPFSSAFNLVFNSASRGLFGDLSLLQGNGLARVLAEPTLVALSGQSASFLAGGELPIPEPQGLGTTTITYKSFGVGLTVTPTVLAADRIALKVAPEASDLDYANAVTLSGVSVPAITTRRADTTIELGDGESFIIGGLVSSNTSSMVNMVPLLGHIPILGAFFRNLNYQRQDKELVFVVTPHLVKPLARGTDIALPGQREAQAHMPVWGSWLLSPAGSDQLPGFSR